MRAHRRPACQVGPVAQWLEPTAHNGLVAGSSPAGPTKHLTANGQLPVGSSYRPDFERNEGNAKVLTWIGAAPGPGGFAFDHYAKEFEKAAERIRVELTRRGLNKESH